MDIEKVARLIESEKINWSRHILERMHKRRIQIEKIIHVVCAVAKNNLSMITAYHPSMEEWEDDFKTRR